MNNKFKPIIEFKTFTVLFYVRGLSEQPYGCQQHTLLFTAVYNLGTTVRSQLKSKRC